MGCDIHAHIEYQEDAGLRAYQWFASPNLQQSYVLFALLAGVRMAAARDATGQEVGPVLPPRGIPPQLSFMTRRGCRRHAWELWDDETGAWEVVNWHSASWLTTEELRRVKAAYTSLLGREGWLDYPLEATLAAMEQLPRARLVFWFDS